MRRSGSSGTNRSPGRREADVPRAADAGRVGAQRGLPRRASPTPCRSPRGTVVSTLSTTSNTNPFDLNEDFGPDNNDRRHNLVFDAAYLIPKVDVQFAGIYSYRSPLSSASSTSLAARRRPVQRSSRAARLAARRQREEPRSSPEQAAEDGARCPRGCTGRCTTPSTRTTTSAAGQPAVVAVREVHDGTAEAPPAVGLPPRFLTKAERGPGRSRRGRSPPRPALDGSRHQPVRHSLKGRGPASPVSVDPPVAANPAKEMPSC